MIAKALIVILDFLNQHLKTVLTINNDVVLVGSLVNPDGSSPPYLENKIVVSVINIEQETVIKTQGYYKKDSKNNLGVVSAPLNLGLYLQISANFTAANYLQGCEMLSEVIMALQRHPIFTRQDMPSMPDSLDKLTLEMHDLPLTELSHVWNGLGANYRPSIIYKMRLLVMAQDQIIAEIPKITELE